MKVLFAVNNESISESIIKKYQQEYKEIISSKNVYYFNAIIKELQKDKTYDRIVVSEDLQPFSNNNYDSIDRFIFEKMDNISDEATDQEGNDIPIILICADRRSKGDSLLVKLFGIGVYNALIEKERSITAVCELLNHPRSKKDAKVYYRVDADDIDYKSESEENVSEEDLQNILIYYKKLGKSEEKYAETFEHIAKQYTDAQLKIIAKFLPLNVKAVLEANSPKYQEIVSFAPIKNRVSPEESQYNNYEKTQKGNTHTQKVNTYTQKEDDIKLDIIERNLSKSKMSEPVIIPSTINTQQVKKIEPEQIQSIDDLFEEEENTAVVSEININSIQPDVQSDEENIIQEEPEQPKRRGRPKKNVTPVDDQQEPTVKRGRGRPKKVTEQNAEEVQISNNSTQTEEDSEFLNLFGLMEEEETSSKPTLIEEEDDTPTQPKSVENTILPGLGDDFFEQEIALEEKVQPTAKPDDNYSKKVNAYSNYKQYTPPTIEKNIYEEPKKEETREIEYKNKYNYSTEADFRSILTKDKKVVAFIGTSKNGTSFLVNNIAEMFSTQGINTAILDLTKNKNSYYIYTENEENLRSIASSTIQNLKIGNAKGIQVHKNLTVYTSVPEEDNGIEDYQNILETLIKNHSLILLDCDFNTNYGYFKEAQELYLVQSYDVLTIQPLTAFLRELKSKNLLDPMKVRVVINKALKMKNITEKSIIGGLAYYNDPSMSYMTELFDKEYVKYCIIPFDEQAYSNYLEGVINCKITLNGYTRDFSEALNRLGNMVYPLITNTTYTSNTYGNYTQNNNNFSSKINNTLNKMKRNH